MAKQTISVGFDAYKPLELDRATAIALVKQRADDCMLMTDFSWVRVPKRQMIGFLDSMRENAVSVMKEPHFTTYYFRRLSTIAKEEGASHE